MEKRKNTEYNLRFVDAASFHHALTEKIRPDNVLIDLENERLQVVFSRYEMDSVGYSMGYGYWTVEWKLYKKKILNLTGIPYQLCEYVLLPDSFTIVSKDFPQEEWYHEENCPSNRIDSNDIECECDSTEGYYPPDGDFLYEETSNMLDQDSPYPIEYPEATYIPNTRTWILGDNWYDVETGEYQSYFVKGEN